MCCQNYLPEFFINQHLLSSYLVFTFYTINTKTYCYFPFLILSPGECSAVFFTFCFWFRHSTILTRRVGTWIL